MFADYNEIIAFMVGRHRWPLKYNMEEMNNWMYPQQKLVGRKDVHKSLRETFVY